MLGGEPARRKANTRGRSNVGGCKVSACVRNSAPAAGGIGLALSLRRRLQVQCWPAQHARFRGARKNQRRLTRWGAGRDGDRCRVRRTFQAMREWRVSEHRFTRRSAALKQSQLQDCCRK